jgi:LysW-gamma-L-lysine carboxypeptidase
MSEELLIELVKRYSPSEFEQPAVLYLVEWMRAHGFQAAVDEVGNAVGLRGAASAPFTLMLLGHIDTVPGEIPVRIEDGWLFGRGSVDAKGPLCAFVSAVAQAMIPPDWRVIVVGAVEEEIATSRGAYHIRDQFTPDLCIIGEPSSADRITLGYKGRLLLDYELTRPVVHTSRPEPSVGALGAAFWQAILGWVEQQNNGSGRFFDQITPSLRAINTTTDHFYDTLRMTVGFRLPLHIQPDEVAAAVTEFAELDARLRAYSAEYAVQGGKNNALVRGMLAAIRAQGHQPGFVLKGGTSDMNVVGMKWDCPIIAYGPGDSSLDHTPDERLSLAEYQAAINTLIHLIEHLEPPLVQTGAADQSDLFATNRADQT